MPNVDELLKRTVDHNASDLIIVPDAPPTVRVDGSLRPLSQERLTETDARHVVYSLLNAEQIEIFEKTYELDFSYFLSPVGRFRINVHYQRGSVAAAIRYLPTHIPSFEELGLPDAVRESPPNATAWYL